MSKVRSKSRLDLSSKASRTNGARDTSPNMSLAGEKQMADTNDNGLVTSALSV